MGAVPGARSGGRPGAALATAAGAEDPRAGAGRVGGAFPGEREPGGRPANARNSAGVASGAAAGAAGAACGDPQAPEKASHGGARSPRGLSQSEITGGDTPYCLPSCQAVPALRLLPLVKTRVVLYIPPVFALEPVHGGEVAVVDRGRSRHRFPPVLIDRAPFFDDLGRY